MHPKLGKYHLLGLLGRGGSGGVVYLARKGRFGAPVALKVPGPLAQHTDAQVLLREIALHSQLDHPRVIRVLESGMAEGLIYFALEYAPGGTLQDLLSGGVRVTPGEAVTVVTQIAEALEYAHNAALQHQGSFLQGILHRDIKPQNIYLDGRGGVKLGDFGIAKPFESGYTITAGGFPGTPPYMAPEQFVTTDAEGNRVRPTPATDVWQLGVVAYEMLTGARPFGPHTERDDTIRVVTRIVNDAPRDPRSANPSLNDRVCSVLLEALDKDPSKRPGPTEFARRLREATGASPESLPATAPAEAVRVRELTDTVLGRIGMPRLAGPAGSGLLRLIGVLAAVFVALLAAAAVLVWSQNRHGPGGAGGNVQTPPPGKEGTLPSANGSSAYRTGLSEREASPLFQEAKAQALQARQNAQAASLTAQQAGAAADAAALWSEAEDLFRQGSAAFDGSRFRDGERLWRQAAEAYGRAQARASGAARVREAKRQYDQVAQGADAGKLQRYASGPWVQAQIKAGLAEAGGENFDSTVAKYEEARKLLEEALRVVSQNEVNYPIFMTKARAAAVDEKWQEALDAYQAAADINGTPEARDGAALAARKIAEEKARGDTYDRAIQAAQAALARGDCDEAARALETASGISANGLDLPGLRQRLALASWNRGIGRCNKGDYDGAIRDCTRAIELKPDFAEAHLDRGVAFERKGQNDRAMEDYTRAIQLKPDYGHAYSGRAAIRSNTGDYNGALEDANKAIELMPDFANAYVNRGVAYEKKGDLDSAFRDYDKAVQLSPNNEFAYSNRGGIYMVRGYYDSAIRDCTKAIELKPAFPPPYQNRAWAFYLKKDYDAAWRDVREYQRLGGQAHSALLENLRRATGRSE